MTRFTVRPARESDNEALVELDRKCTMGEQTTLAFDRAADFFARSKPYELHTLVVAESDSAIVGVGGLALKLLRVGGELLKGAYFYDLRVDPAFRRVGVASAIGDALRDLVKQSEADVTALHRLLKRTPGLSLRTWYGLERGGDLAACFGLWDYSSVILCRTVRVPGGGGSASDGSGEHWGGVREAR